MSGNKQQYRRFLKLDIDEAMKPIIESLELKKAKASFGEHKVNVTSLRLRTFALARVKYGLHGDRPFGCVKCGLKAAFFAVETQVFDKNAQSPHLNLYGVNEEGEEVLMTHDHRIARSLGGKDDLTNTQLMCSPCNAAKAVVEQKFREEVMKNPAHAKYLGLLAEGS